MSKKISQLALLSTDPTAAVFPIAVGGSNARVGLGDGIDIRAFGTVGTADDSAVLTLALSKVPVNGKVIIPAGVTVTVTNVTLDSRAIGGAGTLKWVAGAVTPMLTMTGTRPRLVDLTVDGEGLNHGSVVAVVTTACTKPRFRNLTIQNFRYKFFLTGVDDASRGIVSRCYVYNCCQILDGDIFGIRSSYWKFAQNDFEHVTALGHMIRFGQYSVGVGNPIVGCSVIGNTFVDSVEVGVVCELYTQGIEIQGNFFTSLLQGVKVENTGATTSGINIIGNEFRSIALDTAFNWGAPGTYSFNRCYSCGGGFIFTQGAICEGNYLDACGDGVNACIAIFSGSTGKYLIRGNEIKNATKAGIDTAVGNVTIEGNVIERASGAALTDGIVVRGGTSRVSGNTIKNTGGFAIRAFGSLNSIQGNTIDGATTALYLENTLTLSTVRDNIMTNVSGTKIVLTDNASFRSCDVTNNVGADQLQFAYTIATDTITPGRSSCYCILETEGGAATDDLSTISSANAYVGQELVLRDNNSAHDVTVRHNLGNISLAGGLDFAMTSTAFAIGLKWNGTRWCETFRSTV